MNILFDERLDGELVRRDKSEVLADLQQAVPEMTLLHREEDLRPFECDGLAAYRVLPMLVALPETLDQVKELLIRCHALSVPVVTRGAGTGLSGGALPLEQGVLLVMSRFNQILKSTLMPAWRGCSPACAIWRFLKPRRLMGFTTRRILHRKLPAQSAATWLKTRAACTA